METRASTRVRPLYGQMANYGCVEQSTLDSIPTFWVPRDRILTTARWLKSREGGGHSMLYDLTAIDERQRRSPRPEETSDFTVVYHLMSFEQNRDIRLKVALDEGSLSVRSVVPLWPNANWYEREVWDLFGIEFEGHPHLERLLMPASWTGHPLRKDHVARATELGPFQLSDERERALQEDLAFDPARWGLSRANDSTEFLFLNVGPQHPGTHGVLRIVLQLDGEEIIDAVPDIGFHHRGAEKMAERQTWHTFIPYTDRIDYLGGVMNNLAYLLAVEQLAGIRVPDRAQVIRIMLCELFRLASHLVWYGTFAQDVGALSPVFYMFTDRERIFDIIETVCGGRMHPNWFRIGGVVQDLPRGWHRLVRSFLDYFPRRLVEYEQMVLKNRLFVARTRGIGAYCKEDAIEWGVTGPGLRACGYDWDFRKRRPYSGYEQFDFDIPTAEGGCSYARAQVRAEEMHQSLRIVEQCLHHMPDGPYKAEHPLATPPVKHHTMRDIETLIHHFLSVSWGPLMPSGEAFAGIEATKGNNGYYLVSDGSVQPYRVRIRTPSFPHLQMLPPITRGLMIPDLLTILGSIDFVLADVDR